MTDKSATKKRVRTPHTLDTKLKVIKLSEKGVSNTDIGRRLNMPRSTVVNIMKYKVKVLKEIKSATPMSCTTIRKRGGLIADMEKLLTVWVDDQISRGEPLSQTIIQSKAQSLFNEMKERRGESSNEEVFKASRGWFDRFRKRASLHNIKMQVEAAVVDIDAAKTFPKKLAKIIDDSGYTSDQIFNVGETTLFWKKMPSRAFISREEQSMPGYKVAKERLTLLLGANVSGSLKLKPMLVYRTENPVAIKNIAKSSLPVIWKANKKAWITASMFEDWFSFHFVPTVQEYCKETNIPFNILFLLDNGPGHSKMIQFVNRNVKIVFLPTNSPTLLQPIDQCVVSAFKSYYHKKTFEKCVAAMEGVEGSGHEVLKMFWKGFTILDGVKIIKDAWNDVPIKTLQGAWKKLCPGLLENPDSFEDPVPEIIQDIVGLARNLGLEVCAEDVVELLESHSQPLSDEDLLDLDQNEGSGDSDDDLQPGNDSEGLDMKKLKEGLQYLEKAMAILGKIDPNFERSTRLNGNVVRNYACYYEMLRERKKTSSKSKETSLDKFVQKRPALLEMPKPSPTHSIASSSSNLTKRSRAVREEFKNVEMETKREKTKLDVYVIQGIKMEPEEVKTEKISFETQIKDEQMEYEEEM